MEKKLRITTELKKRDRSQPAKLERQTPKHKRISEALAAKGEPQKRVMADIKLPSHTQLNKLVSTGLG